MLTELLQIQVEQLQRLFLHHRQFSLHGTDHGCSSSSCCRYRKCKNASDAKDVVSIDPKLLEDAPEAVETKAKKDRTPAEKLENSMILSYIVVVIGAVYLIYYFVNAGSILNALSLNIVNLISSYWYCIP